MPIEPGPADASGELSVAPENPQERLNRAASDLVEFVETDVMHKLSRELRAQLMDKLLAYYKARG